MKVLTVFAFLALAILLLVALVPASASTGNPAVGSGSLAAGSSPSGTVEPQRERPYRSYPAPTGGAGFRLYYQKRCYPGCHYGAAPSAEASSLHTEMEAVATPVRERPYRSYPAPTGGPGFRKYYQKRCYPGCHYGTAPTAEASSLHDEAAVSATPTRERPYKSYPAPTGGPGFRKYYQKRCYPGCHYDAGATPSPTRRHP